MKIVTLTLNSTLDKSANVDGIVPDKKLKCHSITYAPGGGGINVTRVLKRLEVTSTCIYPCAGEHGRLSTQLLLKEKIHPRPITVKNPIRENFAVRDTQSGLQYRFGMPENVLSNHELFRIRKTIHDNIQEGDILVLSGSIPESVPLNYYISLLNNIPKSVKVIVDSSGPVLRETLQYPLFLIKPNQKELANLVGRESLSSREQEEVALKLIHSEKVQYVVVSLGKDGAFLAYKDKIIYQGNPKFPKKSTIGAGDSMVAGLLYGILLESSPAQMLKWGVVCGVAATMIEGTGLATQANIKKVLKKL
ncbi:MAG: 1-phosphofructokinase family hexose kinase [Aequorivita sp.]